MRLSRLIGKAWARIWAGVVQDLPPSIEACESCREVDCTEQMWRTCAQRLATEAVLLHGVDALAPSVAKSAELPGVDATPEAIPEEMDEVLRIPPRRRRLSPC
jgi:hypothetical protein